MACQVFRGSARAAESAASLTETAKRNAADAAKQVSDGARHRDRTYQEADALIERRRQQPASSP